MVIKRGEVVFFWLQVTLWTRRSGLDLWRESVVLRQKVAIKFGAMGSMLVSGRKSERVTKESVPFADFGWRKAPGGERTENSTQDLLLHGKFLAHL